MYNPYFNWLPFAVTKGETITIKAAIPDSHIINRGCYLLPEAQKETFTVGASYERVIDETPSEKGRKIIQEKLEHFLKTPYTIMHQDAAVRPTVRDRRPFIGTHPVHQCMHIVNGMGTKGVTLAPFFSKMMIESIFNNSEILHEADISRYFSLYSDSKK